MTEQFETGDLFKSGFVAVLRKIGLLHLIPEELNELCSKHVLVIGHACGEGGEHVVRGEAGDPDTRTECIAAGFQFLDPLADVIEVVRHSVLSLVCVRAIKVEAPAATAKLGRGGGLRPMSDTFPRAA
ncbi:hypothetical protein D3C85_1595740 [compost metagenome]